MTTSNFNQIATSNNPFIETCFGLTFLFVENGKNWIQYINEYGFTSYEVVTMMKLNDYIN